MNLNKYKYCLLLCLGLSFAACGGDDDPFVPEPDKPVKPEEKNTELTFTTEIQTRAKVDVKTLFNDGESMNVFIHYTPAGASVSQSKDNKEFVYANNVWKGKNSVAFNQQGTTTIQAVYPFNSNNVDLTQIPVESQSQTDYLYSGAPITINSSTGSALLTMKHAMSVIGFNFCKEYYEGAGKLEEITVSGNSFYGKATLDANTGAVIGTEKGSYTHKTDVTIQEKGWTENIPAFFCIPFASSGENVNVSFTIDGKKYPCYLPKAGIMGGNKYIFRVALTKYGLTMTSDVEKISLNADKDAMPTQDYSSLTVTYDSQNVTVPTLSATGKFMANIHWGNDQHEAYKENATHSFEQPGLHPVVFETWGVEEVNMKDLVGVTELDLSQF